MSAITHFYHLAALDYLDLTGHPLLDTNGGQSPWFPQHLNRDSVGPATRVGAGTLDLSALRNALVGNYVTALEMRRKAHVAATMVDGKHPCNNAQVPGGMTTKPSRVEWAKVKSLVREIREFINSRMIPDLITVARAYHMIPILNGTPSLFLQGYGCGNLLAFGAFPIPATAPLADFPYWTPATAQRLFVDRVVTVAKPLQGAFPAGVTDDGSVDEALITEDVTSAFYSSPNNLHPSVGVTTPNKAGSGKYTWHKAPRYNGKPYEVGPLARLVANAAAANPVAVSDSDIRAGSIVIPALDPLPEVTIALPLTYTSTQLVVQTLTGLQNAFNSLGNPAFHVPNPPDVSILMSILGRHAARVLEAKYLADAIGGATSTTAGIPMIDSVVIDPAARSEVYNYQPMAKSLKMGRGLTEAPRGALGHWITVENRRIVNYQAVVPSTWNACGKDGATPTPNRGPIEQTLMGLYTGYAGDGSTPDEMVNRLLRAIHPFDICIACSVHMTDTKGNTIAKFRMDPDGRITKDEVAEVAVEA